MSLTSAMRDEIEQIVNRSIERAYTPLIHEVKKKLAAAQAQLATANEKLALYQGELEKYRRCHLCHTEPQKFANASIQCNIREISSTGQIPASPDGDINQMLKIPIKAPESDSSLRTLLTDIPARVSPIPDATKKPTVNLPSDHNRPAVSQQPATVQQPAKIPVFSQQPATVQQPAKMPVFSQQPAVNSKQPPRMSWTQNSSMIQKATMDQHTAPGSRPSIASQTIIYKNNQNAPTSQPSTSQSMTPLAPRMIKSPSPSVKGRVNDVVDVITIDDD